MKLLLCPKCFDVFKLDLEERQCKCGEISGKYTDDINATYTKGGIPLGFHNKTLASAIKTRPQTGWGREFIAFVIPVECPTMQEEKKR